MQQQKLNVVNTIQLTGVSSRYMTSRIYHPEQKKCYIFVGTSQMIYYMPVKKEGTEEPREHDQQQYKLQEFKKIEQTEAVFTCLSTMIYFNDVLVLLGFVQKQTLFSQLHVYSSNANQIYFNPNLFNESKVNLLNMKHKSYGKVQLLFTSSSDYAVRIFRFVDTRAKKYLFELQLLHIFRFEELIIDFDMKCILRGERCVLSHELSNNRVSVGNFDEGLYDHEFKRCSFNKNGDSFVNIRNHSHSVEKIPSENNQSQQENPESLLLLEQKQVSIAAGASQLSLNQLQSQQSQEQQVSPRFLKAKSSLQHSAHNLEGQAQNLDEDVEYLPDLQSMSMKRTHTSDGHSKYSQPRGLSPRRFAMRSATVHYADEETQSPDEKVIGLERIPSKIEENINSQRQVVRNVNFNGKLAALSFIVFDQHPGTMTRKTFGLEEGTSMKSQLPDILSQSRAMRKDSMKSNRSDRKDSGHGPVSKPDEMYISFADLEGMVMVKKFKVNPEGLDLSGSFAECVTSYQVDLGISASYCKFLKCTENSLHSLESKQTMLSKKQQRKQVKFQQVQKQKQQIQEEEEEIKGQNNIDKSQELSGSPTKELPSSESKSQSQQGQQQQNALREVNLNLIVSSLMGEVIEFKNVPQKGLENPVAFPTVDNYNSGVTGLCVKSQDSLEILVSYFDGSVIFFDLNNEDSWNLKLSQPLNSNHFGVYYENTFDSDVVFLVSDDTLQIYELNNYHIN